MRPRWYIPQGIARPAHLPPGDIAVRGGPDGGDGHCVGGPYRTGEAGWQQVPGEGWWIHVLETPAHLLRLAVVEGTEIPDAAGRRWLVPRLLRPQAGGLVSAVPCILGADGWQPPVHLRGILDRLRLAVDPALRLDDAAGIAGEVLAVNYTVHPQELVAWGTWTEAVVLAALAIAWGADDAP